MTGGKIGERQLSSLPGQAGEKEGTGNLSRRKPPYRTLIPYGGILFPEQIAVRSGAGQRQHQHIVFNAVD